MGESGSGKSTLMNIIGVLDKPTSGEYTLDGVDIHKADDDELAGIESIVLCAIGGVIGVGLGIGLGSVLSQVMGYSARPSVARRTLYAFMRLSPAPITPRIPAVPNSSSV